MKKQFLLILLAFSLLLTSCGTQGSSVPDSTPSPPASGESSAPATSLIDTRQVFSDRDLDSGYQESASAHIYLNGTGAECSSNAVRITGTTITIGDEGTYILSGSLHDGTVIVNAEKTDKVQLVLTGASIHSETFAAIYVLQADKVFLTLAEGSANTLSNGGSFTAIDDSNVDSVVFSKADLTLNGSGSLNITSPAGHGIVSKDELTVTGGNYEITTASHCITGKDSVSLTGASMILSAGKDGIHAENSDDPSLGWLYIADGVFDITAEGDGLSSGSIMQIDGGDFIILTGGGSQNGAQHTSEGWDSMGGGMGGRPGNMGGRPGERPGSSGSSSATREDSTSIKGIKASSGLLIHGGTFTVDSADDAVHSNGSLTVAGGTFSIKTGDDAFHADDTLTVSGGSIAVSRSYEGLEGLHILVSGGTIRLTADDDGLNAAGGTDSSGMGGPRGGDMFGGASNGSIVISGGDLYVKASGDGIDANGYLEITGGYTVVVGPTTGDTATLDYDTSAVITGGTFIGTGGSMMAQTFSSSSQGVFAVRVGNCPAGTQITLTDQSGSTVISHAPELDFAVVIFSTPELISGQPYTITIGENSHTFDAN